MLAQYLPQTSDTDLQMSTLLQFLLQLGQGQIRLLLHPYTQLLFDLGGDFAAYASPLLDPLHPPATFALG